MCNRRGSRPRSGCASKSHAGSSAGASSQSARFDYRPGALQFVGQGIPEIRDSRFSKLERCISQSTRGANAMMAAELSTPPLNSRPVCMPRGRLSARSAVPRTYPRGSSRSTRRGSSQMSAASARREANGERQANCRSAGPCQRGHADAERRSQLGWITRHAFAAVDRQGPGVPEQVIWDIFAGEREVGMVLSRFNASSRTADVPETGVFKGAVRLHRARAAGRPAPGNAASRTAGRPPRQSTGRGRHPASTLAARFLMRTGTGGSMGIPRYSISEYREA